MGVTQTVVGLKKQDEGDLDWEVGLNSGFDDATTRLTRVSAGDPNVILVPVSWVGQLCYDTTNSLMYIGTTIGTPPTGVWTQVQALLKTLANLTTLTTTGAATIGGALNANGAVNANQGVVIPTTKKLQVFPGEASIFDGTNSMNPLTHAARHAVAGADPVAGVIGALIAPVASSSTTVIGAPPQTIASIAWDTTGRSGNSRALAVGWVNSLDGYPGSDPHWVEFDISIDGAGLTGMNVRCLKDAGAAGSAGMTVARLLTGVSVAAHTIALRNTARDGGSTVPNVRGHGLLLVDLGLE